MVPKMERLSAETLETLGDEASGPQGSFLPFPGKDGQVDSLEPLRGDVRKAKGKMLFCGIDGRRTGKRSSASSRRLDAETFRSDDPRGNGRYELNGYPGNTRGLRCVPYSL